jgi:hypothetical protein
LSPNRTKPGLGIRRQAVLVAAQQEASLWFLLKFCNKKMPKFDG